jgi:hypothetical protein
VVDAAADGTVPARLRCGAMNERDKAIAAFVEAIRSEVAAIVRGVEDPQERTSRAMQALVTCDVLMEFLATAAPANGQSK